MTNKWQKVGAVLISATLAIAAGCGGGGKKEAAKPQPEPAVAPSDDQADQDIIIPEEKFDAIKSFFDRKRRLVTRCFVEAEEAGEVTKNDKVQVMVTVTIQTSGKITNAKITSSSTRSKVLQNCVLKYVEGWTVTTLPRNLDYSYSFGMGEL